MNDDHRPINVNSAEKPKGSNKCKPRPLEEEQIKKLFKAARKHSRWPLRDLAMLRLMYGHGLRVQELCNLERTDIVKGEEIVIRRLKGGEIDRQVLSPLEAKDLRAYLKTRKDTKRHLFIGERGSHFSTRGIYRLVVRLGELAGLGHVHPHQLRHSTGFKLVNEGVPMRNIQSYLGHKTPAMTVLYTQLSSRKYEGIRNHFK